MKSLKFAYPIALIVLATAAFFVAYKINQKVNNQQVTID